MQAERRALRKRALAAREALPAALHDTLTQRIIEHLEALLAELSPRVLAFCWPYRAEPDLRPFVERWLTQAPGRIAALPVALEADAPLVFRAWAPGGEMAVDRHGIPIPAHGEAVAPEVLLVPVNVFDAGGFRLGYGGGYFDRTLAASAPRPAAIGVGLDRMQVSGFRPEPHDVPMTFIVTESRLVSAGA